MNFYSNVNVKKLKKLLKEEIVSNKREQKILKLLNVPEFISQEKIFIYKKNVLKKVVLSLTNQLLLQY